MPSGHKMPGEPKTDDVQVKMKRPTKERILHALHRTENGWQNSLTSARLHCTALRVDVWRGFASCDSTCAHAQYIVTVTEALHMTLAPVQHAKKHLRIPLLITRFARTDEHKPLKKTSATPSHKQYPMAIHSSDCY